MRKEFLKQLMEDEADRPPAAEGGGSSDTAEAEPQAAQEPLPQGEELKKYIQRFLFFINTLRILSNSIEKKNNQLEDAIKKDSDFGALTAAATSTTAPTQEALNLREDTPEPEPAPDSGSEGPPTPTPADDDGLKNQLPTQLAANLADMAGEKLVAPLTEKLKQIATAASVSGNPLAIAAAILLRVGGEDLINKTVGGKIGDILENVINPIVRNLKLNEIAKKDPELYNALLKVKSADELKKFVSDNYLRILKAIVLSTEVGENAVEKIASFEVAGVPVGGVLLDLIGIDPGAPEMAPVKKIAADNYSGATKIAGYSNEKIQDLIKARKVVSNYKEKYSQIKDYIEKALPMLADITKATQLYYDSKLKVNEAEQSDIEDKLKIDNIIKFVKNIDSNKVNDSANDLVYDGGPKFGDLIKYHKTLKIAKKSQETVIETVKGFLDTEGEEVSGLTGTSLSGIGNQKREKEKDDMANALANNNIFKSGKISADEIKAMMYFIDSIKKDAVNESLNESLFPYLMNWARARGWMGYDYDKLYKNTNSDPTVKTEKDLANYAEFMKKNEPRSLSPSGSAPQGSTQIAPPSGSAPQGLTQTAPPPSSEVPSGKRDDISEVDQPEQPTVPKFFEKTNFIISDKLYSPKIMIQTNSIDNSIRKYNPQPKNIKFKKLHDIALFVTEIQDLKDKFDMSKIFNENVQIPDNLTKERIQAILEYKPEPATESLIKKLIRQEVKQHMKVRIKESLRLQKGPLSQGLVRKLSSLDEEFEDYYNRFLTIYNKMREIPADARTDSNTDQLAIDFVTNLFADLNRPLNEEDMPIPKWKDIDERYGMLYSEFENLIDLEDNFDEAKAKENINFFKREYQKFLTMLSSIAQSGKIGDQTLKINEVKRLIVQELKVLNGKKMVRN